MRSFTRSMVIALALSVAVSLQAAEPEWRFPSDKITLRQWEQFREEVLATPNLTRQEFANQLVLISNSESRVWVFTQPSHPAYPAVVIRAIVPKGTGSEIKRMGHYGGNQAAFDKWWHEFDALDAKIPSQIRQFGPWHGT